MRFLIFFIVLAILFFLLEKIMIKLFGIDKTKKISETPGKNIYRWGRGIILAILEWKYLKESKQYVSSILFLILGIIFIYNVDTIVEFLG